MVKDRINECGLVTYSFSQGGCVCFSDSSLPQLTDTGKVAEEKCADWSDEREEVRGLGQRLINCIFKGALGIFLQCTLQLISSVLPLEECACTAAGTRPRSDHTGSWTVRGLGGGGWRPEEPAQKNTRRRKYNSSFLFRAVSQTLLRITHERFSRKKRGKKEKEKENK